jgi:hypothetical protein
MSSRALLLGTAASVLVLIGAAAAQTNSMATGSGAGGVTTGGTGAGVATPAAPTQLLPQGGVGTGDIQRSLSGLPQQGGTDSTLEAAGSPVTEGGGSGPIATTPTPMNEPSTLSGTGGTAVLTPTPLNAPATGSTAVPPLLGTSVPALDGESGLGTVPGESGAGDRIQPRQLIREGFVRFDGQILSAREASRMQQQLLSQQQNEAASGAQVIVLSGSVFQGTTNSPNVVVVPTRQGVSGQARGGLTARSLSRGQPVLQGTVEAPRVIALAASPGNVLVVQGSLLGSVEGGTGAGQVRAQIVELPAE